MNHDDPRFAAERAALDAAIAKHNAPSTDESREVMKLSDALHTAVRIAIDLEISHETFTDVARLFWDTEHANAMRRSRT